MVFALLGAVSPAGMGSQRRRTRIYGWRSPRACPVWNVVMRALKIAGAAIAAVIVILALLLVIGIPSGFLASEIQARVERATGYRLTVAGSTRIGVWPRFNVTLNDVTLENPGDRDTSSRLTVGSARPDVTLPSVWSAHPQTTHPPTLRP